MAAKYFASSIQQARWRSFRSLAPVISRSASNQPEGKPDSQKKKWNISIGRTDDDSAFTIKLNNVNIKTPMKNLLRIDDETLAIAIANEWKTNYSMKLDLSSMHLTTLAYTAIDNPFEESKEVIANSILEYLKFDTVRFRDMDQEELCKLQSRHWDPIIGWFEHTHNCQVPIEYGDIVSSSALPRLTLDVIMRNLDSHKRWPLVGLRYMTQNLKSFVLAMSLAQRFLKVEQAVELARLETRYQTERWSKVEWEHDLDEQCTNSRVAAGTLFYHLCL